MTLEDKPELPLICVTLDSPMATCKLLTPLAEARAKEIPAAFSVRKFLPFATYLMQVFPCLPIDILQTIKGILKLLYLKANQF